MFKWAVAPKMGEPLWTNAVYIHENMNGTDHFFKVLTYLDNVHLILDRALNPMLFD
jgi:hypothetical protein